MLRRQLIQLLQYFTTKFVFVNLISSMSLGRVKKTTKTTFTTSNNASPGHCLFEALANQGLLVAKQHFTTLRLAHNLTHFLHSIVRLAMCPREAVPFHGTLSRHGITWASSVLRMSPRSCCILLFTLQKACYTRSVCCPPRSVCS